MDLKNQQDQSIKSQKQSKNIDSQKHIDQKFMVFINLDSEKGNYQTKDEFGEVKQHGLYQNDFYIHTKEELYDVHMSKKYHLSRVMMQLYPERKYHFYLDLDNLKSIKQLNKITSMLETFNQIFVNYTITRRIKADQTQSYHVVFYDTVFSIKYIQDLSKNLFIDHDIDPSVYSTDRLFKEVFQNKFGKENSGQSPYGNEYNIDTCEQFTPQIFDQSLPLNEVPHIFNRQIDVLNVVEMYKTSLQNPSDKKDTMRYSYLIKHGYSVFQLNQLRDEFYVSKSGMTYQQHQTYKEDQRRQHLKITPQLQDLDVQRQNLIQQNEAKQSSLKDTLFQVQKKIQSSNDKRLVSQEQSLQKRLQEIQQKHDANIQKLEDKFLNNLQYNYEQIDFLNQEQNDMLEQQFNKFCAVSYYSGDMFPELDEHDVVLHTHHKQRIDFCYCLVNWVYQYFQFQREKQIESNILDLSDDDLPKENFPKRICLNVIQQMVKVQCWSDADFSGVNYLDKISKMCDTYNQDEPHKSLFSLAKQYGINIDCSEKVILINDKYMLMNDKQQLVELSSCINFNDKFFVVDFLEKLEHQYNFKSLHEFLSLVSTVFVYIIEYEVFYVKKYDTQTKQNIVEVCKSSEFQTKYSMYNVKIQDEVFKFVELVMQNILMLKKYEVQFCQFDNESEKKYFFLFQYLYDKNEDFANNVDVKQINNYQKHQKKLVFQNLLLKHIYDVWFHQNNDMFIYYMKLQAYSLQVINKKTKIVPVILGLPGCGKNIVTDAISKCYGQFALPNIDDLNYLIGQFNAIGNNKKFIVCNELRDNNGKINFDKLKSYISEILRICNDKNEKMIKSYNFENYCFISNNYNAVKIDTGDRRYFPFKCASTWCKKEGNQEWNAQVKAHFDEVGVYANDTETLFQTFMNISIQQFDPEQMPKNEFKEYLISGQQNNVIQYVRKEYSNIRDQDKFVYDKYVMFCNSKGEDNNLVRSEKMFWQILREENYINSDNQLDTDYCDQLFKYDECETIVEDIPDEQKEFNFENIIQEMFQFHNPNLDVQTMDIKQMFDDKHYISLKNMLKHINTKYQLYEDELINELNTNTDFRFCYQAQPKYMNDGKIVKKQNVVFNLKLKK